MSRSSVFVPRPVGTPGKVYEAMTNWHFNLDLIWEQKEDRRQKPRSGYCSSQGGSNGILAKRMKRFGDGLDMGGGGRRSYPNWLLVSQLSNPSLAGNTQKRSAMLQATQAALLLALKHLVDKTLPPAPRTSSSFTIFQCIIKSQFIHSFLFGILFKVIQSLFCL